MVASNSTKLLTIHLPTEAEKKTWTMPLTKLDKFKRKAKQIRALKLKIKSPPKRVFEHLKKWETIKERYSKVVEATSIDEKLFDALLPFQMKSLEYFFPL